MSTVGAADSAFRLRWLPRASRARLEQRNGSLTAGVAILGVMIALSFVATLVGGNPAHQDLGAKVLERIRIDLENDTKMEQSPKLENRQMVMVLAAK